MKPTKYVFAALATAALGASTVRVWNTYNKPRKPLSEAERNAAVAITSTLVAGIWFCAVK